jgi:hypothetical protein
MIYDDDFPSLYVGELQYPFRRLMGTWDNQDAK